MTHTQEHATRITHTQEQATRIQSPADLLQLTGRSGSARGTTSPRIG